MPQPYPLVCGACALEHGLGLREEGWPAWARSELEREKARRRYQPSFGISGSQMNYAPYARHEENRQYRRSNRVRKTATPRRERVGAENLFYSTTEGDPIPTEIYEQMFGSLPADLQARLGRGLDLHAVLADALAALPLISQRAMQAYALGFSIAEIAEAEGLRESTMAWLIETARERLQDILMEKLGSDNGQRYRAP